MRKIILAAAINFAFTAHAQAQISNTDQCKDVLAGGAFARSDYKKNHYLRRIIYTLFTQVDYNQSKSKHFLGMPVPIGQEVMGTLDYNDSQFKEKQNQLKKIAYSNMTEDISLQISVSSGDAEIVRAWSDCMNRKGGIFIRAEPLNSTTIRVTVKYLRGMYSENIRTVAHGYVSNGTLDFNPECVTGGRELAYDGNGCVAILNLPDAYTTAVIAVSDGRDYATAYVPPRVSIERVTEPYQFIADCNVKPQASQVGSGPFNNSWKTYDRRCPDRLYRTAFRQSLSPVYSISLSREQIRDGWSFVEGSLAIKIDHIYHGGMNGCNKAHITRTTAHSIRYGYTLWGHGKGHDRNWGTICAVDPSAEIEREVLVPNDEFAP